MGTDNRQTVHSCALSKILYAPYGIRELGGCDFYRVVSRAFLQHVVADSLR